MKTHQSFGLNFRKAEAFLAAHFGQANYTRIWLDDVICKGTEQDIGQCRSRGWGTQGCNHNEDVGVRCSGANESKVFFKVTFIRKRSYVIYF